MERHTFYRPSLELVHFLIYNGAVTRLNIHEAKTHLSRYLSVLERGESILLCRYNQPIAEIRPLAIKRQEPRPIGLAEGTFEVGPSFFEPLPDELLTAFYGGPVPKTLLGE